MKVLPFIRVGEVVMWFHVSHEPGDSDITELFVPSEDRSHGECRIPRYSVSPTVCQCLLACPPLEDKDGNPIVEATVYVKGIYVDEPVLPPPECNISDIESTGERWITQDILDRSNGRIRRTQLGEVRRTNELLVLLKIVFQSRRLKVNQEQEDRLWDKTERVWKPNFASARELQNFVENKPLPRDAGQRRQPVNVRSMRFLTDKELGDPQDEDLVDPQVEDA